MKTLITYFSASGTTRRVAEKIATIINADLFEIEPKETYTDADLNWMNKQSRSSIEMSDKTSRPIILHKVKNLTDYNRVLIGFPVWWYTAPTIINSFIEENNLEGKEIYLFVTSGGSNATGSFNDLTNTYPNLNIISAKKFTKVDENEIKEWLKV